MSWRHVVEHVRRQKLGIRQALTALANKPESLVGFEDRSDYEVELAYMDHRHRYMTEIQKSTLGTKSRKLGPKQLREKNNSHFLNS